MKMTRLQEFLNSPIAEVTAMGRRPKAGDLFGVELECEGRNVDYGGEVEDMEILKDWAPHHDGSLRANHGSSCEWVFNGPVKYKQAVERVDKLFDYFEKRKAKLVTSNRTSLHVHFNMGDKNAYQLVNLFILFCIFEDLFDRYCGEDRKGNLFCLSSRHAEEQIRWMGDACFKAFNFGFGDDKRYCSLNIAAIRKFGTVEFRGMRGLDNKQDILDWLSILNEFCDYACYKMKNPVTLIEEISNKSPIGFLREVFSKENADRLTKGLLDQEVTDSIYEGIRLIQMFCYKIGTEFDKVRLQGKDFWASFNDEVKPELDVDPEKFVARPVRAAPGLGAAGRRLAEARLAEARQDQIRLRNRNQPADPDRLAEAENNPLPVEHWLNQIFEAQQRVAEAMPPVPAQEVVINPDNGDDIEF